jgi:hypothetical protein
MRKRCYLLLFSLITLSAFAQERSVSITIDDVPNVHLYAAGGNSSGLLKKLDSLNLPVAICKAEEAKAIGNRYVELSLQLFEYFDGVALKITGKPVKQIYLCHDNLLNTYLPHAFEMSFMPKLR